MTDFTHFNIFYCNNGHAGCTEVEDKDSKQCWICKEPMENIGHIDTIVPF